MLKSILALSNGNIEMCEALQHSVLGAMIVCKFSVFKFVPVNTCPAMKTLCTRKQKP